MVKAMRKGLGALPARVARRMPHLDSHALGVLEEEVRDALTVLDDPKGAPGNA
jgi:phage terminase Nu1 subunit (DNA packaging protein)